MEQKLRFLIIKEVHQLSSFLKDTQLNILNQDIHNNIILKLFRSFQVLNYKPILNNFFLKNGVRKKL
jgi:hypothetical protein